KDEKTNRFVRDEEMGVRALFGWYLHSRLCNTTTVTPCAAIKTLIHTDEVGIANVEKALGSKMGDILENFGLSMGGELAPNPGAIRAAWKDSYPPKAVPMPPLTAITPIPRTIESNANGVDIVANRADPTMAGPFPSR